MKCLNKNPTSLAPTPQADPSAVSGWAHLQGAEDSALFLRSPVFGLLGEEEGEVEHSHDTTFVISHTAFLQQGASPL